MLKVAKFGGSSMADARQFEKVRDIVVERLEKIENGERDFRF